MKRRTLLVAASGALVGLAGCSNSGEQPSETATPESTGTANSTPRSATDTESPTAATPSAADALVVDSYLAVEGTMVHPGVDGTARNSVSRPLVDCVVTATGEVGGETYSGQARRDRIEAGETWEWEVSFGDEASGSGDTVENITVETAASYPE